MFGAAVLVVLGVVAFDWYVRRTERRFFTHDAVTVVASEIRGALREQPTITQAEIEGHIQRLSDASVINVWFDGDGRPVDGWGHPFRVTYSRDGERIAVTCVSSGRDGRRGTADDIEYTASDE